MSFALGLGDFDGAESTPILVWSDSHFDLLGLDQRMSESSGGAPLPHDLVSMLTDWDSSFARLSKLVRHAERAGWLSKALDRVRLRAPIPRPGKVLCAAANYRAHVEEMARSKFTGPQGTASGRAEGDLRPYHFLKASSCMTGPHDDVVLPSADHRIDWEVELGAIIGKPAKGVAPDRALEHVAGYVIVNDVSCRAATWRADRPNLRSDWLAGKSYDTFLPVGPYFVPAAFVPDYRALQLRLWVNDKVQQDGPAGDMIFSIEEQISYLSSMLTLEPGDLIATGTPAGVGQGKGTYLKHGDVMSTEITGLGRQRNPVRLP